jgi:oleate hydratase
MGFSMQDRIELLKLSQADEESLDASRITDHISPAFFETAFWYMWSTTFAFQPWHSAVEFRRYLLRFLLEFSRIETLAGVKRTVYNQYDSLVAPLMAWLKAQGVQFVAGYLVTDLDHQIVDGKFAVTALHCQHEGQSEIVEIHADGPEPDLVFIQNGSMTDASSVGSTTEAAPRLGKAETLGWSLWEKLAAGRPEFGNPAVFNSCPAQSSWESFTVTLRTPDFFNQMIEFSGNEPGTGGLVTFQDSNWMLSVVLATQPHFPDQPAEVQVFWGYSLFPDRIGNFVAKTMSESTGAEILRELCGHLRFEPEVVAEAICIPCTMPYITSMFMPRRSGDRPLPVPKSSKNLAFVSQFVEIPNDVVFTVEYSVRAAQMAVYELLGVERAIPPVTSYASSLHAQFEAVVKSFR